MPGLYYHGIFGDDKAIIGVKVCELKPLYNRPVAVPGDRANNFHVARYKATLYLSVPD